MSIVLVAVSKAFMSQSFQLLQTELPTIRSLANSTNGAIRFFAQEVLRFHSLAGTMLANQFALDDTSTVDERYLTHILSRSLLENYFWVLYLFDDSTKTHQRYEELKNAFKKDYAKLLNEPRLCHKDQLEPADHTWVDAPRNMDLNSMLAQLRNNYGDRLNYLYFVYRIASFDTHGKSMPGIFEDVFQKQCTFPVLKLRYVFDLIANEYLELLKALRQHGAP